MDVSERRNGLRHHRRGAIAAVVALSLFAAFAVSTSVLGGREHAGDALTAAANDPASDQYQWHQRLAHAVPVATAAPQTVDDGYHHLIVTTTDAAPPDGPTIGPDGTRGRWARLNAPGTPSRFTEEQQRTLLPYVDDIQLDREGATWVKVKENAPADLGLGASASPAETLAGLPGTTVTRIDDHTWSVRTKQSPTRVAAVPGVASIGNDQPIALASTPQVSDDPMSNQQWALQNRGDLYINRPGDLTAGADANVPPAWTRTRGAGVVVAVIDTAVDFSNPDLAGALWTNPNEPCGNRDTDGNGLVGDCHGWDFGTSSATDQLHGDSVQEHGSHVAGIIAATAGNQIGVAGIAPEAKIMPLAISDKNGQLWVSAAVAAINYAADHHVQVINASWGGTGAMPSILQSAIDRAEAAGVLFVAAAGNNGVDTSTTNFWPANAPNANVISVGASTGTDGVASFSNYSATKVHVFAPGQYILSTLPMSVNGGYGLMSGTSMASPYVAGEAALLRSLDPTMSATQTKNTIMQTAKRLPAFAGRSVSGGRIDAGAAVAAVTRRVGAQAFNFDGFDALDDAAVRRASVETALDASDAQAHPNVSLTFTLATRYGGQAMAVTDYPLDITLPDGTQASVTTDGAGTATVDGLAAGALTSPSSFGLDVGLPAGFYALATQFHDGAQDLGTAGVVVFEVGGAGATPLPTTTPAPSTTPAPTTPTTRAPGPTPTTSPAPPTTSPAPPTPTTTPAPHPGPTTPPTSPSTTPSTSPAPHPSPTTTPVTNPAPPTPTTAPRVTPTTRATVPTTSAPTTPTAPTPPTAPAVPGPPPTPAMLVGSAANGGVALSWSTASGAIGYRVYEDDQLVAQTTATSTTIDGLVNGQAYQFAVSAYSTFGESGRTQSVALTPNGPVPPDPSTTAPAPAPVPTTAPAPAPTTSTTAPVATPGAYTITPASGPTTGDTTVTIMGPHLDRAAIEIDGAWLHNVNVIDSTWVIASTSAHATPGTYDVVLHFPDHDVVLPHAFTYTGPSAPTTTTPTTHPPAPTPTTRPPAPTPTTRPPAPTPTTRPSTPTTSPAPPAPTPPTTSAPVTTPPTTSAPPVLAPGPNGHPLRLAALAASSPLADLPAGLWDGIACRSSRCTG